jgi:hypothetical protein
LKKSTQKWLLMGAAAAAIVGGAFYYEKYGKKAAAAPAGTLPAGSVVPVASFSPGQKYTIAAPVPATITSSAGLSDALKNAGWANVTVLWFQGAGSLPAGFEGNATSYVAEGTWNGAAGTPVPSGVLAAATP